MNYLDRNEFNFEPSQKVVEAIKNFDPKTEECDLRQTE